MPANDASADQTAGPEPEDSRPAAPERALTSADLRRPKWLAAHVGIVLLMAVFVLLGRWQWHVGHKVQPLTNTQLAVWHKPEPLESVITPTNGLNGTQVGQAVQTSGTYDATHQLLVPGRVLNGHQGFYVLTPLITGTGQDVVVNRGWLPAPAGGTAEPAIPAPPTGRIAVTGWAAEPESTTGDVNVNGIVQADPGTGTTAGPGEVSEIAPAQLVNMWPYPLLDGYVSATDARSTAGGLTAIPAPLPAHGTAWDLLNVGYAFQWCLFAVITGGWYVLYWRREIAGPRTSRRDPDLDDDNDDDLDGDGDDIDDLESVPDTTLNQLNPVQDPIVDSAGLSAST